MASFFTYFTSGFGTLVLVTLLVSLVTGNRIDTGAIGLIGFPILAFLYALARKCGARTIAVDAALGAKELGDVYEHPRYPEYLQEDPEREYIYKEDLPKRFAEWLEAEASRSASRGG